MIFGIDVFGILFMCLALIIFYLQRSKYCELGVTCNRTSIYIGGRYLKVVYHMWCSNCIRAILLCLFFLLVMNLLKLPLPIYLLVFEEFEPKPLDGRWWAHGGWFSTSKSSYIIFLWLVNIYLIAQWFDFIIGDNCRRDLSSLQSWLLQVSCCW